MFYTVNISIIRDSIVPINELSYFVREDTLNLKKSDTAYYAGDIEISIMKKAYSTDFYNNRWEQNLMNNKIVINYMAASKGENCSVVTLNKINDLIIRLKKNNRIMVVLLKLYDGELGTNGFEKNIVNLYLPFCEGTYEITNSKNPRLIGINEDEE